MGQENVALVFYCGSGSPYAWRVWLALEHKGLPHEMKLMSFDKGDLKTPAFTALNPRQKVPVLVHDGFAIWESAAIVEYIEDAFANSGPPLLPATPHARGTARRLVREADEYLAHAMEQLVDQILFTKPEAQDPAAIAKGRDAFVKELAHFERALSGEFFVGAAGAVDYTVYPIMALALRMEKRKPDLAVGAAIGPKLAAWMKRVETLPHFARTYPPHWK